MSGKLDRPLDDIVSAQRRSATRRRPQRRAAAHSTPTAPAGGIQKATRATRGSAPAKAASINMESKIIVSNLPKDVLESQIKEYFVQSVGPIKRVDLVYGPNSMSRGIANVTFHKADGASKAFQKLNGLLVDNRPIKIEIVVGASQADKVLPAVKSLADRTSQPKSQARSAASGKQHVAVSQGGAMGVAAQKKRRGRSGRPFKKTAEELDSEMADYFVGNPAMENSNGDAPAANGGDATMEDDIM